MKKILELTRYLSCWRPPFASSLKFKEYLSCWRPPFASSLKFKDLIEFLVFWPGLD